MLRTITIICCFSLSLNVLFSQQNNTIQNKLLEIELSIFNEVDSSLKAELILEKINLLSANNLDFSAIINEYERIDFEFLNDSLKAKFFWNAALIYYFNDDIYTSIYYQKKNEELRFVQIDSTKNYLLKFILYSKYNLEIALKFFDFLR